VAKKMVDSDVEAGIEIIKHQTHIVNNEMSGQVKEIVSGHVGKSIFDLRDECALNGKEVSKKIADFSYSLIIPSQG